MYIYIDSTGNNYLIKITALKNRGYYGMRINGQYGGGFYARDDNKALEKFNAILAAKRRGGLLA